MPDLADLETVSIMVVLVVLLVVAVGALRHTGRFYGPGGARWDSRRRPE